MFINFKHKPSECPREDAVVRVLQADEEVYPLEYEEDFNNVDGKDYSTKMRLPLKMQL